MTISPESTHTRRFLETVESTVTRYRMLTPEDRVLVGVSGGPDSVALLHGLLALKPEYNLELGVFHLNHCLRGAASDSDARFVKEMANSLDMPFYGEAVDVAACHAASQLSLEEAARKIRHGKIEEIADKEGYQRIALGHNWDDNAELMLMFLFRGSGAKGLSGIPPTRGDRYVRPLIRTRRSEIMAFLQENRIASIEDKSNNDLRFLRNKIRQHLLPLLQSQYNPKIKEALNRTAMILRDEEEWIEAYVEPVFKRVVVDADKKKLVLSQAELKKEHPAIQRRLLRRAIHMLKGDTRRITLGHVDNLRFFLQKAPEEKELHLPGGLKVTLLKDRWVFTGQAPDAAPTEPPEELEVAVPREWCSGQIVPIAGNDVRFCFSIGSKGSKADIAATGQQTALFDMDRISFPLQIRYLRPGDRFRPLGMEGTQKVSKFLKNNKVPRANRRKTLLLTSGDRIIWVAGHRISDEVKITRETIHTLTVRMFLPNHPR